MGSTYTDQIGQGQCKSCPSGFAIATNPGAAFHNELKDCINECKKFEYIDDAARTCKPCRPGYSCDGVNEQKCEPGSYCKNGTKLYCSAGKYGYKDGASDDLSCYDCDKGTFQPGVGQRSCYDCPSGFHNPNTGQIEKVEACLPCSKGMC